MSWLYCDLLDRVEDVRYLLECENGEEHLEVEDLRGAIAAARARDPLAEELFNATGDDIANWSKWET